MQYLNEKGVELLWKQSKDTFAKKADTLKGYGISDVNIETKFDSDNNTNGTVITIGNNNIQIQPITFAAIDSIINNK